MNLKEFLESPAGKEAREFFITECSKINDINNIKECSSAANQALEFKATRKAAKILTTILNKIITLDNLPKVVERDNYV